MNSFVSQPSDFSSFLHVIYVILIVIVKEFSSLNAFLVVLKLHDKRLNVLAFSLPISDGFLSVGVEVLLLLISESLSLKGVGLVLLELSDGVPVLDVSLVLLEVRELHGTHLLLFALLFLSHLEFFVSYSPEISEFGLFLLDCGLLGLFPLDLELTTSLDGSLHLSFSLLLLLKESIGTILSFCHLSVENLLLVILKST